MYFHHNWKHWKTHLTRTFPNIKDHVLLERANHLLEAAKEIQQLITEDTFRDIVSLIPEDWLIEEAMLLTTDEKRAAYIEFLSSKLNKIDELTKEAINAK